MKLENNLNALWKRWLARLCCNRVPVFSVGSFFFKDLKPSNLAVNEDCELKVKDH